MVLFQLGRPWVNGHFQPGLDVNVNLLICLSSDLTKNMLPVVCPSLIHTHYTYTQYTLHTPLYSVVFIEGGKPSVKNPCGKGERNNTYKKLTYDPVLEPGLEPGHERLNHFPNHKKGIEVFHVCAHSTDITTEIKLFHWKHLHSLR